jgi:hypothetical protein
MEAEIPELRSYFRMKGERERAVLGEEHPDLDMLATYHFRKLSAAEAEQIRDHLAVCKSCVSSLLEFAEFCSPIEPEPAPASPKGVEPIWTRRGNEETVRTTERTQASLWRRLVGGFGFQPASAMAAVLLAVSLPLGYWGWSLSREKQALVAQLSAEERQRAEQAEAGARALAEKEDLIATLRRQQAETESRLEQLSRETSQSRGEREAFRSLEVNLPVVVFPVDRMRAVSRSGEPRFKSLPENVQRNEFSVNPSIAHFDVLIPNPLPDFSSEKKDFNYELVIVRESSGERIWASQGLTTDDEGYFSALLPSRLFPSGRYRFTIYKNEPGKKILITEIVSTIQSKRQRP